MKAFCHANRVSRLEDELQDIKGCHCAAKQYNANTVKLFLKAASKIAFIYLRMCTCGMLRGVKLFGKWYALGSGSQHETTAVLLNPDAEFSGCSPEQIQLKVPVPHGWSSPPEYYSTGSGPQFLLLKKENYYLYCCLYFTLWKNSGNIY